MEFSQEDIDTLNKIKLEKEARARQKEYWSKVMSNGPEQITADEILEDILEASKEEDRPFLIDDENRRVVELLSWYFAGDPRFENAEQGYSLEKGIYLYGSVGVGKTQLMRLLMNQQRKPFVIVDCTDVSALYRKAGEDGKDGVAGINKYFKDTTPHINNYWRHPSIGWCFDDLGLESDGRYFGNQVNVMERILEVRYKTHHNLTTHIISNLTALQVKERYGVRIAERCREMFNVVEFSSIISRR